MLGWPFSFLPITNSMLFASLFILFFIFLPAATVQSLGYIYAISFALTLYTVTFLVVPWTIALCFASQINNTYVIEHSRLLKVLGIRGLAIYPVVFVEANALTEKGNVTVILNHESIHLAQQKESLVLPFYIMYMFEESIRAVVLGNGYEDGYLQISFEKEAYMNERKKTYLQKRIPFVWFNYMFTRNHNQHWGSVVKYEKLKYVEGRVGYTSGRDFSQPN